jgi:hypothetical protein
MNGRAPWSISTNGGVSHPCKCQAISSPSAAARRRTTALRASRATPYEVIHVTGTPSPCRWSFRRSTPRVLAKVNGGNRPPTGGAHWSSGSVSTVITRLAGGPPIGLLRAVCQTRSPKTKISASTCQCLPCACCICRSPRTPVVSATPRRLRGERSRARPRANETAAWARRQQAGLRPRRAPGRRGPPRRPRPHTENWGDARVRRDAP